MSAHDLALAYALSSIAGLRSVLTLLALAIAVHVHLLAIPVAAPWLASDPTLAVLAVLAILDGTADKIPVVDHLLHGIHVILAPLVGAVSVASVVPGGGDPLLVTLAVLGGVNALGVHAVRSSSRVATNAVSLGLLAPVVSVAGDVIATGALVVTFAAPYAAAALACVATLTLAIVAWRVLSRRRVRDYASSVVPPR